MKTLKFMLAAATAIGLASATQADQYNSTGFEKLAVDTAVTTGLKETGASASYFYYAGATAEDNESVIVEGTPNIARPRGAADVDAGRERILQVSTGTDPILRTYAPLNGQALQEPTALEGTDVYVDTLVQFTVTPHTDTVTPGANDKLMIYLKESVTTNDMGEITSADTNLVVVGGFYSAGTTTAREYVLDTGSVTVNPNEWHRLTVKVVCDISDSLTLGLPGFAIWVDGEACSLDYYTCDENDPSAIGPTVIAANADVYAKKLVLSLLTGSGQQTASLQGVGFAGEGKVDDIVFSDLDPFVTALDFTLTWGNGLSAVEYTITNTTFSLSGATSPATISVPIDYPAVTFTVANADGVQKTLSATASGSTTGIDATDTEFFWSDYLGEAVSGAYVINDLAELVLFKKGVATLGTSGETFKLGADIDATDLGYFDGIGTASGTNGSSGLNGCTFDGAGYTISNVKFTPAKYRGFFNQVLNSTIQNLTINVVDIQQTDAAEHGYSAFAGNMKNSKIQNCVATGTIGTTAKPAMHTCGGFAVKSAGGNVFENCSNDVDIVCSLTDNPKIGGIVGLVQEGAAALTNCWNSGDITITCKTCDNAGNGAGGLVGYAQSVLTICGGGNEGTVQSTDTTAHSGSAAIKVGTIIAMQSSSTATISGGTVAQADAAPAGAFANIAGLDFATVDGNVATFVDTLAAGNTYKVMNAAATATYNFTALGTIAFDESLTAPTAYAITAASGLAADSFTAGNVVTYYATDWASAPAEHPWYENPGAVVLAENLPGQTQDSNGGAAYVYAFHGQGEGEYLGLTYSTNPMQFDLFQVDGTNALTAVYQIPTNDYATAGFRGVAISKTLGIVMTLSYTAGDNKMYVFPLAGGGNGTAVTLSDSIAFDAAAFSPDGRYLFSNSVTSPNATYYKWAVSNDGTTLTKVGTVTASGRGRNLAYARINGRDLVFGLVDTGKIAVIDMTGDDASAWSATDMITDLPSHSYGSLCVSGVKVTGGTPHLTVATSLNGADKHVDVLNVYALTVPASGAVTASPVKSFDEAAMTAAGFGDISDSNRYGNTVYVTEDEATIYFARPDNKLYAAQYAEPAQAGWVDDYTTVTNQTVAQAYPSLASTALATANAGELTVWAKANSVDFSTAAATFDASSELYTEAFLLNCAPTAAAVADEKEDFVANITFENGVPVVTPPAGKEYNGTLQLKGKAALTDAEWTDVEAASSTYKFYKYELSL